MQYFRKEKNKDFSKMEDQILFTQETRTSKSLIQKELDVNRAEQQLLKKRIELMKSFLNDIPSYDPYYSMFLGQLNMDQIEIDELKVREIALLEKLSENKEI